uniref:Uncharacterized protein n=1 Tax=Haptolina ericina TaxID=156174 RepID=A0A7S3BQ19_9EUKA
MAMRLWLTRVRFLSWRFEQLARGLPYRLSFTMPKPYQKNCTKGVLTPWKKCVAPINSEALSQAGLVHDRVRVRRERSWSYCMLTDREWKDQLHMRHSIVSRSCIARWRNRTRCASLICKPEEASCTCANDKCEIMAAAGLLCPATKLCASGYKCACQFGNLRDCADGGDQQLLRGDDAVSPLWKPHRKNTFDMYYDFDFGRPDRLPLPLVVYGTRKTHPLLKPLVQCTSCTLGLDQFYPTYSAQNGFIVKSPGKQACWCDKLCATKMCNNHTTLLSNATGSVLLEKHIPNDGKRGRVLLNRK